MIVGPSRSDFALARLFFAAFLFFALVAMNISTDVAKAIPPSEELSILASGPRVTPQDSVVGHRGGAVRVETQHSNEWPGVVLQPAGGEKWDLSAFEQVNFTIRNVGAGAIRVCCRLDNPKADGIDHCVDEKFEIAPGETRMVAVTLPRVRPDSQLRVSAMRGAPPGVRGDKTFDVTNVTRIIIAVEKPSANHVFDVLDVQAVGRFEESSLAPDDPKRFFPFIDKYGQYVHREWPGKTHDDAELAAAGAAEAADLAANPGPKDWDEFGGWSAGPKLKATGYFYPAKHRGKWWLVDPNGRLFFSHGITCVNYWEGLTIVEGRENWFAELPSPAKSPLELYRKPDRVLFGPFKGKTPMGFDFAQANLIRKYGKDWKTRYAETAHRRLRSWGMNTIANWSDGGVFLQKKTPYVHQVWFESAMLEGSQGYWGKFRDVFDPSFEANANAACKDQVKDDPWCIGYFIDNEMGWGDDTSLAKAALASPADQAAKKAFLTTLQGKYGTIQRLNAAWKTRHASWDALLASTSPPTDASAGVDLREFNRVFCERYFKTCREAIKAASPKTLYLGCRFDHANPVATAAAVKYCDVVSFNLYRRTLAGFEPPGDVPVMLTEFHFGAPDRGLFHGGLNGVPSQNDRAIAYRQYVGQAVAHPNVVGTHWFKYQDEPATGRPLDGENYQCGFVDVTDTPYPETVQASREVGYSMYRNRVR